jgi:hypothetical protein
MSWMTDERAAAQILRGLADDQNPDRWKIWLRYGFIAAFAGIAVGGTYMKMRSPSALIARVTPAVAAQPETTMTFMALLPTNMPQGGRRNPEAEKMRWLLKPQRKQGPPRYGSDPVRQSSPLRSPSAHSDSGMRPRTHCSDTDVGETAKLIDRCNP